ncbi:HK97-gp10 family putative phage morphogenesis protein [Aureimonas leprariae]|uniref:Uncharacterized protein n=1 Tax=Plantimonas leprariae TaxID=2615207 RepID=A0A7V7PK66_9HYPH|nr:HK97-gp10 family putative phage morphogenesis protein [Aureimonas leprariae]KAB0676016.1 hypothetical protein F6X38_22405 [Aureimonas leprariae]
MTIHVTARVEHKSPGKLKAALRALHALGRGPRQVKVGFPAGKANSDIVARATFNEFGTRTIPERPFMRNAMRANWEKYRKAMEAAAREIVDVAKGGGSPAASTRKVLGRLGALAQGDIQSEITSLSSPPNAPSTVRQKGSSKPLIDTGEMRSKVTWKVEE